MACSGPWVAMPSPHGADGEGAEPAGGGHDPLDAVQQLLRLHVQRRGELYEGVYPWESSAALDKADLGSVKAGEGAEFFLREPGASASHEQIPAEASCCPSIHASAVAHAASSSSWKRTAALVGTMRLVSGSSRPPLARSRTARR